MTTSDFNQNSKINKILSSLMEECDIDDAKLAIQTGIPASTIARIRLYPDTNPTVSTLRPLAKFFSITIDQLLGDVPFEPNRLPGYHNPIKVTHSKIPLISWNLIIPWINADSLKLEKQIFKTWLSTEKEVSERSFALSIQTESFGLALRKDSLIMLDPCQQCMDGDVILIHNIKTNSLSLRQLIIDKGYYTKSLNYEIKEHALLENDEKIMSAVFETRFSLYKEKLLMKEENIIRTKKPRFVSALSEG